MVVAVVVVVAIAITGLLLIWGLDCGGSRRSCCSCCCRGHCATTEQISQGFFALLETRVRILWHTLASGAVVVVVVVAVGGVRGRLSVI